MKLTVGLEERDISEADIRDAQHAFLQGKATQYHKALIDACLSHMAQSVAPPCKHETLKAGGIISAVQYEALCADCGKAIKPHLSHGHELRQLSDGASLRRLG